MLRSRNPSADARSPWCHDRQGCRLPCARHEAAPENLGSVLADLRFEIEREEGTKEIAGEEGGQQETLDGVRVVPVDMVGMPALDQFVEPMILDIPSLMTETDGPLGGDGLGRKGSHTDPVAGSWVVFAIELPFHGIGFERTDDSHRSIDLRPGKQIREVPPQALAVAERTLPSWEVIEESGRVLVQVAPVVLEYRQSMFATSQKKVEKWAGGVRASARTRSKARG